MKKIFLFILIAIILMSINSFSQTTIYQTDFENISNATMLGKTPHDGWLTNDSTVQRNEKNQYVINNYTGTEKFRNAWLVSSDYYLSLAEKYGISAGDYAPFAPIQGKSLGIGDYFGPNGTDLVGEGYLLYIIQFPACIIGTFDYWTNLYTDRWAYRVIPTTNYKNNIISFQWKCVASLSDNDYGQVGYSLDGGLNWTWLTTGGTSGGKYYNQTNVQTANINLPPECDNQNNLAIAFRFRCSGNGTDQNGNPYSNPPVTERGPAFIIDNLIVQGTSFINCNSANITSQPVSSGRLCSPASSNFSVTADGDPVISYKWQVNNGSWGDLSDGGTSPVYSGSATTALHVSNATSTYKYRCIVSNCTGANPVTSNEVTIDVISSPPTSNLKFINQTKYQGDNVSYDLSPGGSGPFTFQWIKNGSNLVGETKSIFSLNSVTCGDSGVYSCRIENGCTNITAKIANLFILNCFRYKYAITGNVKYDNKDSTLITNTDVHLLSMGDNLIDNNTTDANGYYVFVDLINDSYKLRTSTTKAWGGSNPTDALLVNKHYIGIKPITDPLKMLAADVNNDNKINPTDALMINRRYIGVLPKFIDKDKVILPDWLFTEPVITLAGLDITQNIIAICTGDVNASYSNIPQKIIYKNVNLNSEIVNIKSGEPFEMPVYISEAVELGAIGLKFQVPSSMFQVLDLKTNIEGLIYNITNDGVNIAWSAEREGISITPDKPLFYIKAIYNGDPNSSYYLLATPYSLSSESVLADINDDIISNDKITIPKLSYDSRLTTYDLHLSTYPNPFISITNIKYSIPEDANINLSVFNVLGEKIACLFDDNQIAGEHNLNFDASSMREGIYYCVLRLTTKDLRLSKTNILMITK